MISAILVLVAVFQFATQTVFATSEIKSDVISEEKGKFRVYMDSRFLDKKFCIEYAQEIIDTYSDGKSFHGMDSERIAIEIYCHAFMHYAIYFIKATPFYLLFKSTIDSFYRSSDPIDVNYRESESRMKIFNLLWGKF